MLVIEEPPVTNGRDQNSGPRQFRISASRGHGLAEKYVEEVVQRINVGTSRGVSSRVVESGLHVFVEDALTDPLLNGLHELVKEEGYRSLLAVPMYHGGRVIGSVNLYYDKVRRTTDDEVAVAQAFADQVALALARLQSPGRP